MSVSEPSTATVARPPRLNWPVAVVLVAVVAGFTTSSVVGAKHHHDDSVACSKNGGEWHDTLFTRTCRMQP